MALMGGIVLFFGFPFRAANGGFAVGAVVLVLFGVWKLFAGKQACWECSLAIRQRWLLNVSFAADLILFALRMVRRMGKISWIAVLESICALVSFWFLVRFIYHLAHIIDSKWGHRLSIIVMNSLIGGVGVLVAVLSLFELQLLILPPQVLGFLLLASLATIFVSFVLFLALAWQMSRDLDRFASFLLLELVSQNDSEEE
jgi:hypothetical protein